MSYADTLLQRLRLTAERDEKVEQRANAWWAQIVRDSSGQNIAGATAWIAESRANAAAFQSLLERVEAIGGPLADSLASELCTRLKAISQNVLESFAGDRK